MIDKKLPKHAKRVFKGQIFDVYQWRQKMYDGSHKIFERVKRQGTVIVIASIGNKVIVLKQKQPGRNWYYSLVAGRMDVPGETPRQTAVRELREETGRKATKLNLWRTVNQGHKVDHAIYIFIAQDCKIVGTASPDSGEKIKPLLVSFARFLDFWNDKQFIDGEIKNDLLRAKMDKRYRNSWKKAIFG